MTVELNAAAAALVSATPHHDIAPDQQIFRPFIGSWDLRVTWYDENEVPNRRENGEWHFMWALEGRAVQDIWIVPRRAERSGRNDTYEYGTSVRFFDPRLQAWRSTWIGPTQGIVHTFIARQVGSDVVLETTLDSGFRMRWTFVDITDNSFTWRNLLETESGWVLTQDFQARRAKPGQPHSGK